MPHSIAQVVVGLPVPGPFDYFIPENLRQNIRVGSRVYVQFRAKLCVAYVVELLAASDLPKARIKTVISVLDNVPTLDANFLKLTKELSEHYACSWGEAIEVALPAILRTKKGIEWVAPPDAEKEVNKKPELSFIQGTIHSSVGSIAKKVKAVFGCGQGVLFLVPEVGHVTVVREFLEKVCGVGPRHGGLGTPSDISSSVVADLDRGFGVKRELSEWLSVKEGRIRVAVGTRSAVFAMMPNLGLIVMLDEENPAFKQEPSPFYHARHVALLRQKYEHCDVLFVSPAPTAELWKILKDKKANIEVSEEKKLSTLQVIDLANYKYQNMLVSFPLQNDVQSTLTKGGKILMFLNRRGFSTLTKCNQCGFVVKCGRCNSILSYLYSKKKMFCPRCDALSELPKICPQCQSAYLRSMGTGIEKLESELAKVYPGARIAVYDSETKTFDREAQLMVATQAVMPFLHRGYFSLIAVLDFDGEINRVDFRAGARAFSLLTRLKQAAGEKLIVQTRHPQHEAIKAAVTMDAEHFYRQELKTRRELGLPPFIEVISLALRGVSEDSVLKQAQELYEQLVKAVGDSFEIAVPQPDLRPKLRDKYRFTIMLKGKTVKSMLKVVDPVLAEFSKSKGVILTVDVNP
ncbi:MAG: primosomal protein N' [Candidatus Omnitrophica bacterium]|nr:primosomal protein N' [Candidatus Omnitrophota bacterium]